MEPRWDHLGAALNLQVLFPWLCKTVSKEKGRAECFCLFGFDLVKEMTQDVKISFGGRELFGKQWPPRETET